MKKINLVLIIILFGGIFFTGCSDYVTDVETLVDVIEDDLLLDESQIPFQVTGVKHSFASRFAEIATVTDGLSDETLFDVNVPYATYPDFQQIEPGGMPPSNRYAENLNLYVGLIRKSADILIERVTSIGTFADNSVKEDALFNGYLYSGLADYLAASYIGHEGQRGAPINNGPLETYDKLYDMAIQKFQTAITHSPYDYNTAVINTLIARTYLFKGEYSNSAAAAANGMQPGNEPFQVLYSSTSANFYFQNAGVERTQWVVTNLILDIIAAEPEEANRIPLDTILGLDEVTTYYRQHKYPTIESPINFITWQENHLILAELAVRGVGSGNAETLINEVRTSHNISAITGTITTETIYMERVKEFFATGIHLIDQRRFDKWHLPGKDPFFPVSITEINENPNIN